MGDFCTVQDVRLALTPSASPDDMETAAGLPAWQLEDAIREAEGVVRSYLTRYVIPLEEVTEEDPLNPEEPPATFTIGVYPVRGWARNVAAYLASLTWHRHKDIEVDDPIRLRYAMTVDMLRSVRDRVLDLSFPPSNDVDTEGVHVENLYEGNLFGLEDFNLVYDGYLNVQRLYPLSSWEDRR